MKALPSTLVLLFVLLVAGCAVANEEEIGTAEGRSVEGRTPVVLVTDPEALKFLEQNGFSFAERFAEIAAEAGSGERMARESTRYRALQDFVRADVATVLGDYTSAVPRKTLPTIGDGANTAVEKGERYHAFNAAWLESPAARFELIAVSNRIDRRGVPERARTCGEQRLVYRLAYSGNREDSRLPFTVVVTFPQRPSASCQAAAERWLMSGLPLTGAALGKWLQDNPLRALAKPIAFELNFQADAWSRFVRGADGVGRHHQYSLRVLAPTAAGGLEAVPLENTPDVTMVDPRHGDPAKKAALLAWIKANLASIDEGRAVLALPNGPEVRAARVSSFSAMGLTRTVNRPYTRIFGDTPRDLAELDLGRYKTISTPAALLRRLDQMTCNGCHATRSIVGFHLVGEERTSEAVNAMANGMSAHLRDEMFRRDADLRALANDGGGVPMPAPERGFRMGGIHGAPCALPRSDAGFRDMTCSAGLKCVEIDGAELGTCTTDSPTPAIGERCETHTYQRNTSSYANADGALDKGPVTGSARTNVSLACQGGAQCGGRENGFPLGGYCVQLDGNTTGGTACGTTPLGADIPGRPGTVCSLVPFQDTFSKCAGFMSMVECVAKSTTPGEFRACDLDHPCRDEYVCGRAPNRASGGGVCLPGYVIPQLEIDVHLVPDVAHPRCPPGLRWRGASRTCS
jgi:hypothetical protein